MHDVISVNVHHNNSDKNVNLLDMELTGAMMLLGNISTICSITDRCGASTVDVVTSGLI